MLAHILSILFVSLTLTHLGTATPIPKVYGLKETNTVEDPPNVAEFDLFFGVDCTMPALHELEQMLRHHFELGVFLYDADVDEEIDVTVNIQETWKIGRVVSHLQKEGLSCDMSISEAIFVTSEMIPDSNEFLAHLYESGFMHDADHEETEERRNLVGSYPEVLDLRQYSTAVKHQGDVESCAAFAATTTKEIHERMDYGLDEKLSPRFVYAHRGNGKGMTRHQVFTILRDEGIPLDEHFPILGRPYSDENRRTSGMFDKPSTIPSEAKRQAKMHRISSVTKLSPSESPSVAALRNRLKELLNQKGAGIVSVSVFGADGRCDMYKKQDGEKLRGYHMMSVVGYDQDGLIIRNSWGSGWCNRGDMNMSWDDAKKYAIEFNFYQDTPSRSCKNFEVVTGTTCWSLGRAVNTNALCGENGCSRMDVNRCCVEKKTSCLNKNSCCAWGTTCYGCPDNGNSQFEWAWNCGTSRRCNGKGNKCRKSPGECCIYGSDCHGCPWGNEHVWPTVCGSSRRCKLY